MSQSCCHHLGQKTGVSSCLLASGDNIHAGRTGGGWAPVWRFQFWFAVYSGNKKLGGFQMKSCFLTQRKTWREQNSFEHYVRLFCFWRLSLLEKKKKGGALHQISVIFLSFSMISEHLSLEKFWFSRIILSHVGVRDLLGRKKVAKTSGAFWWHMQRVLASRLGGFGEEPFGPQFLPCPNSSSRRSINCSHQPVPGQTWGMFFVSWCQPLNLSSTGFFFFFLMYLCLDAEAALQASCYF